jgi:hypothetical protein
MVLSGKCYLCSGFFEQVDAEREPQERTKKDFK